ncbi:dihydrofolate reductase family protein [Agrococcus sp. SGAir0287]|uniref:dihydrofolate reductase family protein n=1 Tax=Agrococcus sp. SGAir0287 TaxID=2070347 RepID=UPI0010CD29C2|nr:dihydrofolate reductase family protein [Agrococcus sp. SGAir0287]QCR20237.1 pyrimidine reductase [Agrococcus sp. SGAir0287]
MTTIVSTLFIALDGVAEIDPAWHFPYFDDAVGAAVGEDYAGVDALILGRVTYDSFAGAWPDREAAGGDDAGFAKELGDLRKIVATRGLQDLGWRNAERSNDVVAAAKALRDEGVGKVLVAGSISIVRQLLAAGQLDELRLLIHPVAAGTGERLFAEGVPTQHLSLVSADALPTGMLRTIYRPAPDPSAGGDAPATYEDATPHVAEAERRVADARGGDFGVDPG